MWQGSVWIFPGVGRDEGNGYETSTFPLKKWCKLIKTLKVMWCIFMFVIWTNHGNPKTFIFRGYNPYFGGVKPLFFLFLGSKGMNKANIYQDLHYFFHSVCFFFSQLANGQTQTLPPEILLRLSQHFSGPFWHFTLTHQCCFGSFGCREASLFCQCTLGTSRLGRRFPGEKTWENPWQKPWQEGEVHWIWNDHPPKKNRRFAPPMFLVFWHLEKSRNLQSEFWEGNGTETHEAHLDLIRENLLPDQLEELLFVDNVHHGRSTWNLQITHSERKMMFQSSMIMVHVNLQGCNAITQ